MKESIQINTKERTNFHVQFELPNECPICHHKVHINNAQSYKFHEIREELEAIFFCPNQDCSRYFIGFYHLSKNATSLEHERFVPHRVSETEFSEIVNNLSPSFVLIYREALQAKEAGLVQIAGPGFRKAFEFLIKDYAKSIAPEDKHKEIEESFSGKVVKEFINDPRVQKIAERTLWLGNDETHYLRKWQNHDLNDLLNLIQLAIYWVNMDKLAERYTDELK